MIEPRNIGPLVSTDSMSVDERRIDARAVVPGQAEVRDVEVFDARAVEGERAVIMTPDTSTLEYLSFARHRLTAAAPSGQVALQADEEAIVYVNRGNVSATVDGTGYSLGRGDLVYLPIGKSAQLTLAGDVGDISEYRARDCHTAYPVRAILHRDIEGTELAANLGSRRPMSKRTVFKLVDNNIDTCRLLFGNTYVAGPGAVGSYPPHFHGPDGEAGLGPDAKEEIYHFRCESELENDTPFVLQNCARPGEAVNTYVQIFDEQAINVTPSYHDTIAPPAVDFMFVWCLCSFTENNRDWSRIHNRPGYENEW